MSYPTGRSLPPTTPPDHARGPRVGARTPPPRSRTGADPRSTKSGEGTRNTQVVPDSRNVPNSSTRQRRVVPGSSNSVKPGSTPPHHVSTPDVTRQSTRTSVDTSRSNVRQNAPRLDKFSNPRSSSNAAIRTAPRPTSQSTPAPQSPVVPAQKNIEEVNPGWDTRSSASVDERKEDVQTDRTTQGQHRQKTLSSLFGMRRRDESKIEAPVDPVPVDRYPDSDNERQGRHRRTVWGESDEAQYIENRRLSTETSSPVQTEHVSSHPATDTPEVSHHDLHSEESIQDTREDRLVGGNTVIKPSGIAEKPVKKKRVFRMFVTLWTASVFAAACAAGCYGYKSWVDAAENKKVDAAYQSGYLDAQSKPDMMSVMKISEPQIRELLTTSPASRFAKDVVLSDYSLTGWTIPGGTETQGKARIALCYASGPTPVRKKATAYFVSTDSSVPTPQWSVDSISMTDEACTR